MKHFKKADWNSSYSCLISFTFTSAHCSVKYISVA